MHGIRARLRLSSFLALFALAVQLALSFGHVHLDELSGRAPAQIEKLATAGAPTSSDRPEHADGYCAICAIIHLAGTLVPATVPFMPLPADYGRARPLITAILEASTPAPSFFAARAPPLG
jgi:hypothetical protein